MAGENGLQAIGGEGNIKLGGVVNAFRVLRTRSGVDENGLIFVAKTN